MKTLMTLHNQKHLDDVLMYTDGILLGNNLFGTRLTNSFSIEEIIEIARQTKKHHKLCFLIANQIMTDDELDSFSQWMDQIDTSIFDGIIVADLGVIMLLKEKGLAHQIIYNPETLITNDYDFNFLHTLGIQGVYAAKEITLEDVKRIGTNKSLSLFLVGHGHLNMFYSKRQLIKNYSDYLGKNLHLHQAQDLTLIEEKRLDEPYPILEDIAGTHVFRSNVLSSMKVYDELTAFIDYFVIDTLFKDDVYGHMVSKMYHQKQTELIDLLQENYHESWDDGFYFKKTIYKSKEVIK
ncbi:MAG: U32 family peptidase [Acholeplasmataceae bacterium]|jgi:putative protease|nr:U32 family peptidase [Acholeplasmataceae bacterium]